jgi:hypothetical protein
MTAKTRKQQETILTGAAVAARSMAGVKICGAFGMDDAETLVFVTVGGDDSGITPRQLGRALERVGTSLQGKQNTDADVTMIRRNANGDDVLPLDTPLGDMGAVGARARTSSASKPGAEPTITGLQIVALLKLAEKVGRNLGRALAYKDVLGSAEKRLKEQEEILKTAKEGSDASAICMGEIMAYRVLLDAFDGAIDYFTSEGSGAMETLSRYVVDENIPGVEDAAEALVKGSEDAPG